MRAMDKPGTKRKRPSPPEAPRARRARAVSELLPSVGGPAFRRFGFVQSSIVSRWREIVGDRYAGVTAPESIRFPPGKKSAGVLTLVVEGAHAPMLQHVVPVIIERVNRFFGYAAVARVNFRQGIVRVAAAKARGLPVAEERPLPSEVGESLRQIADPELRACLEALARSVAASEEAAKPAPMLAIPVLGKLKG